MSHQAGTNPYEITSPCFSYSQEKKVQSVPAVSLLGLERVMNVGLALAHHPLPPYSPKYTL